MRSSLKIAVGFSVAASALCAPLSLASGQTAIPADLQRYYDENQEAIKPLIAIIGDKKAPAEKRLAAFDQLRVGYPRAALDPAIALVNDENVELATTAVTFLSSIVVMMNHGPGLANAHHGGDDSIAKAVDALRKAIQDQRQPVREIAAASLASLNDETALKSVQASFAAKKISDVEALQYITLAKPEIGAGYVAGFLDKSSLKAQSQAISYLSSSAEYRGRIKKYLLNEAAPVEIRAAAAKGLARNDPQFGNYAAALVANSKLPSPVFDNLVSEMGRDVPASDMKNVLTNAIKAQSEKGTPDALRIETLKDSITRYEAVRPELDSAPLQNSLRTLGRT
jgi:HEAT repeat protein